MKKRYSSVMLIFLVLVLLSIPVIMVFFYRSEFENYEIDNIDEHLGFIQDHAVILFNQYGDDEDDFLSRMTSYMSRHSDYGSLVILDEDYEIIFPQDTPSREAREALAEEFAEGIQQGTLRNQSYHDTGEGQCLRIAFSGLRRQGAGSMYVVSYFDTDTSSTRIDRLESIYLQIAVFSLLFFLGVAVLFYWNYYRFMQLLSEEILRIGTETFAPLAVPPSIGISEKVRQSLNTMQQQIQLSSNRRENLMRSANHFIRNHLMAVDGYAQGIEMGVFAPQEAAEKIRMENMAMEELLHNLSIRAYIKEQTLPENDEILCPADEIEECFSKYRRIAEMKNVALTLLPVETEASVRGTKSLMETVLDNLVSNAVRYASSRVVVSVEEAEDQVRIKVADDGRGIGAKEMAVLFQPMFKGSRGNIGIGLSVAQSAATYMGGSLTAENGPDGGAVFTFSIPAV